MVKYCSGRGYLRSLVIQLHIQNLLRVVMMMMMRRENQEDRNRGLRERKGTDQDPNTTPVAAATAAKKRPMGLCRFLDSLGTKKRAESPNPGRGVFCKINVSSFYRFFLYLSLDQ